MAPRRNGKAVGLATNYDNLSVDDALCPICRCILIKPITLPCNHGFCSACIQYFDQDSSNQICPLCHKRVSSWLRMATKTKKLVNEPFWQAIQERFPVLVRTRLNKINGVAIIDHSVRRLDVASRLKEGNEFQLKMMVKNDCDKSKKSKDHNGSTVLMKKFPCIVRQADQQTETMIQRKNRKVQEITQPETKAMAQDRSDSIESECVYFRPIECRKNTHLTATQPIRVPTKRPIVVENVKIIPPEGNRITISNHSHSAFAIFCAKITNNIRANKRPLNANGEKPEIRSHIETRSKKRAELHYIEIEKEKRQMQEEADRELAMKLQEEFNLAAKYATRSNCLQRAQQCNKTTLNKTIKSSIPKNRMLIANTGYRIK